MSQHGILTVSELSKQINDSINRSETYYQNHRNQQIDVFTKKILDQSRLESAILVQDRNCKTTVVQEEKSFYSVMETIDYENVANLLRTDFFDANVMEKFRCIINSILDSSNGEESMRDRIHEFIKGMIRFGTHSVNGFALKTSLRRKHIESKYDMFVLKCPRNPFKSREMVHEVCIGIEGLNDLRNLCPNFSYVYDSFSGGTPVVGENNQVVEYDLPGVVTVSYALYENVGNSVDLTEEQKRLALGTIAFGDVSDPVELVLCYLQVVLALRIANTTCDFTHYDAHNENVLLRRFNFDEFYIKYQMDEEFAVKAGFPDSHDRTIYLKTKGRIATFIDYGMSHIVSKNGDHLGILDVNGYFNSLGIKNDESNYMSDPYKLICMLMYFTKHADVKTACLRVLDYFYGRNHHNQLTQSDASEIGASQWDGRFHVPKEVCKAHNWSMSGLFRHCMQLVPAGSIVFDKPNLVLGDENYKPINTRMRFSELPIPTCFDLYNSKDTHAHRKLIITFFANIDTAFEKEVDIVGQYINYTVNGSFVSFRHLYDERHENKSKIDLTRQISLQGEMCEFYFDIIENLKYLNYTLTLFQIYMSDLSDEDLAANVATIEAERVKFAELIHMLSLKADEIKTILLSHKCDIKIGLETLCRKVFGMSVFDTNATSATQRSSFYELCSLFNDVYGSINAILPQRGHCEIAEYETGEFSNF